MLAAVGFLGALAGLRWRPLGLLSVSVLCTLDPVVRLLLMRGGFLRFNTLNYVALLALVVFPRTLARWRNAQVRLLVVLIFILTIGLLFSPGRELGVQHLLNLVSLLGILVYLRRAGSSSKNWLWLGLVGGLSAACVGALFYLQSSKIDYVNSNAWVYVPLGGMLTVCLAAAAGKPRRLRALTLASIAIVNAMWVLLSGSRGGLLVAIVCVCFLLVTLKDAQVRLAMVLAGGMAVLAMGAWFADQELNMLDKISTLLDSSRSASKRTDGHFDLALGGWNVFVRHPLGVGTGGFAPTWAELGSRENVLAFRSGHEMQAHSAWIKTLAENGVLGFLCLAVWVASFLWIGWRSGRKNAFRLGGFRHGGPDDRLPVDGVFGKRLVAHGRRGDDPARSQEEEPDDKNSTWSASLHSARRARPRQSPCACGGPSSSAGSPAMRDPSVVADPEWASVPGAGWDRRLLVVGNFLPAAKNTRSVCAEIADRLRARGYQVYTASASTNRAARLLDMLATTWRRRREYSLAQIDIFSGSAFLWAEIVCWALRRLRKPYVLALHGGNLPSFARRWPGRVRRLLAGAATVTSPSDYLRSELKRFRSDIQAVPNGLSIDAYPFRARRDLEPRLVWLRAFHEIYNPTLAVRVAEALGARFQAVRLTMIGPDKGDGTLSRVRRQASAMRGPAAVELQGSIAKKDVPDWLNRADIFLNTTNVDNHPTTVLEAMACGLCVVSTNVGGLPHMLSDGVNALLVPAGDLEGMTDAVSRLLADPDLAEQLSRAGRIVAERHDWSVALPQWEKLLESAASRSKVAR